MFAGGPKGEGDPPIVVDIGSFQTKIGYGTDDNPVSIFPTVIGKPKSDAKVGEQLYKNTYVGEEALLERYESLLDLVSPIEKGLVTNVEDMYTLWNHAFYIELRWQIAPEMYPFIFLEKAWTPLSTRVELAKQLFEDWGIPALYFLSDSSAAMYASGKTTGITLSMGHNVCAAVPVYEGFAVRSAASVVEFGGGDVANHLAKMLNERGYTFTTHSQKDSLRQLMKTTGYVALDFEEETKKNETNVDYTLPDGSVLSINSERFKCGEAFFDPSVLGVQHAGLQSLLLDSLNKILDDEQVSLPNDESSLFSLLPSELKGTISNYMPAPLKIRQTLLDNIVLEGGASMFKGMSQRLEKEWSLLDPTHRFHIHASEGDRSTSAWLGASILASYSIYADSLAIRKEEYDEVGQHIVNFRCLA